MSMMDWNTYRQQVVAGVGGLAKLSPDTVRSYVALSGAGQKTGHLDAKTREMISAAAAFTLGCDGFITVHVETARELGATWEELAEALGAAISGDAGAAAVHSICALDAFEAAATVTRAEGMTS